MDFTGPLDCQLECKQSYYDIGRKALAEDAKLEKDMKLPPRTFIGPIRVVLISTPLDEYRKKVWGNAFVFMAYFAIGMNLIIMYFYCCSFRQTPADNLHIWFFVISTQVLAPVSLLTRHIHNGSIYLSKPKHKKLDFFMLKAFAFLCFTMGLMSTVSSTTLRMRDRVWSTKDFSAHGFTGLITAIFVFMFDLPSILFCYSFNYKRMLSRLAVVLTIPGFLASLLCFILAIVKKTFLDWLPSPYLLPVIIACLVYYTFMCCFDPIRNLAPFKREQNVFYS